MPILGEEKSVRFVEIDSMGNEREIGIAKNYNVSTASVMNPISGFGSNGARPHREVTIEVEGWKTPIEPITSTSQLVHRDHYDALERRALGLSTEVASLKADLEVEKTARVNDQGVAQGLAVVLASMVHMMGGSVIVHQSELTAANAYKLETVEQPELSAYLLKIEE